MTGRYGVCCARQINMTNKRSTILFLSLGVTVLVIGLLLRIYNFRSNPATLYIDEMAMLVDAKSVVSTGKDIHGNSWLQPIFISYGDYKQPVYIWFLSAAVALFGNEQWVVRIPSLLAGLLTMCIAPLIGLEFWRWRNYKKNLNIPIKNWYLTQRWLGLAIAVVVAVSPWSVTFSRAGFEGHLAQLLFSLSIYALQLSFRQGWWRWMSIILMTASAYTYYSVRFVAPIVVILISIIQIWQLGQISPARKLIKHRIIDLVGVIIIPLIGFYLLLYPQISSPHASAADKFRLGTDSVLNERDEYVLTQNIYRELAGNTFIDRLMFHRSWILIRELAINYADFLSFNFLFLNGDDNLRHGTGAHGLFLLPFLPIFIWGSYDLVTKNRTMGLIVFLWWMVALLPAAVPNTTPHALRSLNALVPLSIIIGVGLYKCVSYIVRHFDQFGTKLIGIGWTVWVIFAVAEFSYYYQIPYQRISKNAWANHEQTLIEMAQALNISHSGVYFWGLNSRLYLWIAGQPDYDQFPLINNNNQAYFDQDFATKRFDNYFINEGLPRIPEVNEAVLVMSKSDWDKLTVDDTDFIVKQEQYLDLENNEFVVAVISRKLSI